MDKNNLEVINNADKKRFEVAVEGKVAFAEYMLAGKQFVLTHTEVPEALEGQGIGSLLAKAALGHAREHELKVLPICPFMAAYIRRHPEYQPLVFGYKPPADKAA